ncbi:hypothetical protein [Nocardia sp. CA-119907]|uniref:hypothetical protein n=1 Tax=Nocardia sp. CA-119907 TaxID=3239973 RepID=UPI003D9860AD
MPDHHLPDQTARQNRARSTWSPEPRRATEVRILIVEDERSFEEVEIQVIQDVIDAVEAHLRGVERRGAHLHAPRSRLYAAVIHTVIASARLQSFRATLDSAEVLDALLDGPESEDAREVFDRILKGVNQV